MRIEFPQGTSTPDREVITRALTDAKPAARVWIVPKPAREEMLCALVEDMEIDVEHQAANPTAPPLPIAHRAVQEQWECRRTMMSDGSSLWRVTG